MRLLFIGFSLLFLIGSTFAMDDTLRNVLQELHRLKKTVAEQGQIIDSVTGQLQKQQKESVLLKAELSAVKEKLNWQQNEIPKTMQGTKHDGKILKETSQNATKAAKIVLRSENRLSGQLLHLRTKRSVSPSLEIGFTATRQSGHPVHENGIIVFDAVTTNIGFAYNPTTGLFKAPSDGLYVFFFNIECAKDNGDTEAELVRDGARLGMQTYCHGLGNKDNSGTLGVLHLHFGDTIWVKLYGGDNRVFGAKTLFSGFLVKQNLFKFMITLVNVYI
ncbi:multimerin-1-like [Saccostrea cucullata]|uniref:multimerin-1-like n=1 Tax=Saccostrea cuccullata TaxID=36930 RepID=UPI002ED0682E